MSRFRGNLVLLCVFIVGVTIATTAAQGQATAGDGGRGQGPGRGPEPSPQIGHPSGKLVIWGDVAQFINGASPDNCILKNRYKKGERIGFRMTAIDGGTGEPENSAVLTAHLVIGGRTIDVPVRFRGALGPNAPPPRGYLRPTYNLWTGFWLVPEDAPTGILSYTVTATDKFGRTADFIPFPYENSQLTIVQ
jgi:hypothetical protein